MSHRLAPGATSREMDVIAKLTTAEERATDPGTIAALGAGLELIRSLVADRGSRQNLESEWTDPNGDDYPVDLPCSDE